MTDASETGSWRMDLPRLARVAWARRGWLLKVHVAALVLAIAVVLLLPRWWTASVTLVPAPNDPLGVDLSGTGMALGGMSMALGTGPTPQDELRMVVKSRAVADSLVRVCRLRELWNKKRIQQAREKLADCTTITTPKEGQVEIAVEARTPQMAVELANMYALYARLESVRLKSSLATQRRIYLESRMHELENEITVAAMRVRVFEEQHGAVSLPDQTRASLDASAAIQTQLAQLETELAAARRYFTENSPPVATLRDQIAELERQSRSLRAGADPLIPAAGAVPAIKQQYLALTREEASLMAVSEMLRRFYEQARVDEANPVPAFSVLDAPETPEKPSRPQRGLTVAITMVLVCAASLGWAYWTDGRGARGAARPAADAGATPALVAREAA